MRAYRLAQMRKRQDLTQEQVAAEMGVRQPRVSQIERGELDRVELSTIRAYVAALGGRVELVADFGDERLVILDGQPDTDPNAVPA